VRAFHYRQGQTIVKGTDFGTLDDNERIVSIKRAARCCKNYLQTFADKLSFLTP
jgi:hypothetical protein